VQTCGVLEHDPVAGGHPAGHAQPLHLIHQQREGGGRQDGHGRGEAFFFQNYCTFTKLSSRKTQNAAEFIDRGLVKNNKKTDIYPVGN